MEISTINPFAVQTPESMSASDVNELFVDVFSDFYHIPKPGHTFINGPRGTGKSMMFRFMLPDCQTLYSNKSVIELDYLSLYIPIRKTIINIVELHRLQKHADFLLNEHLMCTYFASKVFDNLQTKIKVENSKENLKAIKNYYEFFTQQLFKAGYEYSIPAIDDEIDINGIFSLMLKLCDHSNLEVNRYVKVMAFTQDIPIYTGTICGYLDFLFPILTELIKLPFLPSKTIYLLIDDADNLNRTQTMVLNTWLSFRTSAEVSLKISTQLSYKTYKTISGISVDSPHDFSEINISTIYTSSKDKYKERLKDIIRRRLKSVNINVEPENFFPVDEKQENEIAKIAEKIKQLFPISGKGYRANDDAYRMSRPEYIKSLHNRYTYKYAGFDQLINISSGIIRYFLEPASLMYSEMQSRNKGAQVSKIEPSVQDEQVREFAEKFLVNEIERITLDFDGSVSQNEKNYEEDPSELTQIDKLKNLIESLGGMFHLILLSDLSERRVFTIALSDKPSKDITAIFKLGVKYGYLQEGTIGNKDGTGRTTMYVLSRRLAPYFTLDPNGFSAYKFITSQDLIEAIMRPSSFLRKQKQKISRGKSIDEDPQLNVFSE